MPDWAPPDTSTRACTDPRVVHRESALGRTSDSRRTAEAGIAVSQSTVATYMRQHPRRPSQTWRTFLTNHASQIMAADLFVVPTVACKLLFVLVMRGHDRRRIVPVAITHHPTAAWTAQQLRNAFSEGDAPTYLLHDRDTIVAGVATTIAAMGVTQSFPLHPGSVVGPPRPLWMCSRSNSTIRPLRAWQRRFRP